MAILNRYKDNLDDFINSSDPESPDWPGPIDEGSRNIPRFASNLMALSEGDCLDKDVSDCQLARRASETGDSEVH